MTLHDKFVQYYGEVYIENETQLPWLVGWILMTTTQSDKAAKSLKMQEGSTSSVMLMRASMVLDGFVKREGNGAKEKDFEFDLINVQGLC